MGTRLTLPGGGASGPAPAEESELPSDNTSGRGGAAAGRGRAQGSAGARGGVSKRADSASETAEAGDSRREEGAQSFNAGYALFSLPAEVLGLLLGGLHVKELRGLRACCRSGVALVRA